MKKVIIISVSVIAAICAVIAVVLGIELFAFIEKTPVITPKDGVSVQVGGSLSITDLAVIEKATEAYIVPSVENNTLKVSEDGQSVLFGSTGTYEVRVEARGANSEHRSELVVVSVS